MNSNVRAGSSPASGTKGEEFEAFDGVPPSYELQFT